MIIFESKYTTMKKIIFLFAAIVALSSCTITKRHYAPGYHVEWKKSKNEFVAPASPSTSAERILSEEHASNPVTESPVDSYNHLDYRSETAVSPLMNESVETERISEQHAMQIAEPFEVPSQSATESNAQPAPEPTEVPIADAPSEINKMALIGFILSMSSFLIVITALPGLIVSVIGLKQINEGRGEGKGLAIAGIVIGALYTLVLLFYVAYLAFLIIYGGI